MTAEQKLHEVAARIAASLNKLEGLLDSVGDQVFAVNHAWVEYGEHAPLGLRRKDLGANPLRFAGQLEGIVVDRLRLLLRDAERPFASPVPPSQGLDSVGAQFLGVIDCAIAAHAAQHRARCEK